MSVKLVCDLLGITRLVRGPIYKSAKRLDGHTAVITGANTGIGLCTAKDLCRRGARVLILCRNEGKAQEAVGSIRKELEEGRESSRGEVEAMRLDLSSMASIRECAELLLQKERRLNYLVLNAGVMMSPLLPRTSDGFEMQMGTNHLGHFLLTRLLLPALKRAGAEGQEARIVSVSSVAHLMSDRIRLHDLNWDAGRRHADELESLGVPEKTLEHLKMEDEEDFKPVQAYAQSKLANILFAAELGRRLKGTGVTTYSLHPGVISTELDRHARESKSFMAYFDHYVLYHLFGDVIKTPWHGAQTTLYCLLEERVRRESGGFYSGCGRAWWAGRFARSEEDARRLWEVSERLTKCEGMMV